MLLLREPLQLKENQKIYKGTNISLRNEFWNVVGHKSSIYKHSISEGHG